MKNLTIGCVALVGLGACGGGGIVGIIPPTVVPEYITLNDTTTGGDSVLGGKALIVGATSTSPIIIRNVSGKLTHDSRALTGFTDGVTVLTDADGDASGTWTDGTTSVSANTKLFGGSYSYAGGFDILNTASGSGPMIVGVVTKPSAIPSTGSASYTGDAFIQGATLGTGGEAVSSTGTSMITANFGNSPDVSVTIEDLDAPSFDKIEITNMSLSGNRTGFSGGTLKIYDGTTEKTSVVLGSDPKFNNQGNFFGGNTAGTRPAEAGGVFVMSGSDANIAGGYIGK